MRQQLTFLFQEIAFIVVVFMVYIFGGGAYNATFARCRAGGDSCSAAATYGASCTNSTAGCHAAAAES